MSNIATSQAQFDSAWWAAQDPRIQAFKNQPILPSTQGARQTALVTLAHEGCVVEPVVLLQGWDPWYLYNWAQPLGYTWVPSILMGPVELAPGLSQGSVPTYNPMMIPQGGIYLTLDMDLLAGIYKSASN